DAYKAAALLWLGAKVGYAIGAARSRGLGWVQLREFRSRVDGHSVDEESLVGTLQHIPTMVAQS
ncbi:MAG: hypothetical protein NZ473_08410, partial [Candidatus Kapabacteria bacterium]|nr:hypothetical protein [Candidatus Kapabacteria bacterium]MDW8226137.1 hypothetical protein [Bacteroidota bacterium]